MTDAEENAYFDMINSSSRLSDDFISKFDPSTPTSPLVDIITDFIIMIYIGM